MIHLQPTPEQEEAALAAARLLQAELPTERLRPRGRDVRHRDLERWPQMGSLGFFGLGLAEDQGGVGCSVVEEVLVFREFGRHLVAPRILGSALGAHLAAAAGRRDLSDPLLAGITSVGLLLPIDGDARTGEAYLLDGDGADQAILWVPEGAGLFAVGALRDAQARQSIDSTLSLSQVRLDVADAELWIPADRAPIPRRGNLLCAAMLVGLAEGARDDSVQFAKLRHQFGQPIGAFQAVKHRCADMATRAAAAWAQTLFATLAEQEETADVVFQVAAAKIVATDSAIRNAQANIQNHGATGFTAEVEAHHYLKRSHLLDQLGADQRRLRDLLMLQSAPA